MQNLAVSALCFPQLGQNIDVLACFGWIVSQRQAENSDFLTTNETAEKESN